jgi:aminoglycoside 3-N-acetyltransferase
VGVRKLLGRLPQPLLDRLRTARKRYRSVRYRTRERLHPVRIEGPQIEAALREAGLREGDAAFVQAGMSSFGTIEGGPDTVIEAFARVLGPDGLIAMPSFPLDRPALEYLRADPVFDLLNTPSRMGAISERFRTSEGVVRSLHPTHPVCARGPGAEELVAGHELAPTPFGAGTPFARLIERGAHQVYFGSGVGAITMYHAYECLREPPYPIEVFLPQRIEARCIDANGEAVVVHTLVHDPRVTVHRIDNNPPLEAQVRERLIDGGMRSVTLGRGEVLAQTLPELLVQFEQMLGEGSTIYPPELLAEARVA